MKEKKVYNVEQEANEEKIDFQEILFKYLILGAWLYLRMATPVYNISATVLIKDDKKVRWCRIAGRSYRLVPYSAKAKGIKCMSGW